MATKNPVDIIEGKILDVQKQEAELAQLQQTLEENEQFTKFMQLSQAVAAKRAEVRAHIETVMIPAYQDGKIDKSIKGPWGSVTVTEHTDFDVNTDELPTKFFKKVVDSTKIRKTFELEGVAPKGTTPVKKYGIMMKLKGAE